MKSGKISALYVISYVVSEVGLIDGIITLIRLDRYIFIAQIGTNTGSLLAERRTIQAKMDSLAEGYLPSHNEGFAGK